MFDKTCLILSFLLACETEQNIYLFDVNYTHRRHMTSTRKKGGHIDVDMTLFEGCAPAGQCLVKYITSIGF